VPAGAWRRHRRAVREQHGILAELVLEPSEGEGETVVITAWPSHEVFDAWIATPDRDRLTDSDVHQAVDYRPITRYDVVAGYLNIQGLGREHHEWVAREHSKTDRIACPWLIRRFIDPDAEFLYVPADQVLDVAGRERAHSYDGPGARYTHRDGLCSFEVLVEEYAIADSAVHLLARIVHGADVADDRDATPESRGLLAVGFHYLIPNDDHRQLQMELPVYDALYEWCLHQVAAS
jgi:heme-degrading monooxygenase HmoA